MALRKVKPTSPGRRFQTYDSFEEITKSRPEKSLVRSVKKSGGRNNAGRTTCRHRGGGHKRRYRAVDFKRDKVDVPGKVASIEYDPNRSARIALLHYEDGDKRYILAPHKVAVNDKVVASSKADIQPGNVLPLKNIPLGMHIHNIEMRPGKGAQIARSAGTYAQLMAKEGRYAQVKLPSGEVRMFLIDCRATIGMVGNLEHENVSLGKAGRSRWRGRRPRVRGVAKNPVDHPMGGGEGKASGGRHPCSPWGMPAKGYRTRKKNHRSDKYIVRRRKR